MDKSTVIKVVSAGKDSLMVIAINNVKGKQVYFTRHLKRLPGDHWMGWELSDSPFREMIEWPITNQMTSAFKRTIDHV